MTFADDKVMREGLRKKFPKDQIGTLPATQKRPALSYIGHAAVVDRLNEVAPDWFYVIDQTFDHGGQFWVRGTMTIGGVSRPEYGDGDDPKDAIGNFIRRGAMRFGVALDLWSKEDLQSPGDAGARGRASASSGNASGAESPASSTPAAAKASAPESTSSASPPKKTASDAEDAPGAATDNGKAAAGSVESDAPGAPLENRRMAGGKYKGFFYRLLAKKEPAHLLNADDEELGGDFHNLAAAWVAQENPEAAELVS